MDLTFDPAMAGSRFDIDRIADFLASNPLVCSAKNGSGGGGGGGGKDDDDDLDVPEDDDDPPPRQRTVITLTKRQLNKRLERASTKAALKKYGVKSEEELERLIKRGRKLDDDPFDFDEEEDDDPPPRRRSHRDRNRDDNPPRTRTRSRQKDQDDDDLQQLEADLADTKQKADRYREVAKGWKKRAVKQQERYEQDLADRETEYELKIAAVEAGVDREHLDYVLGRVAKHVNGLDQKQAEAFDASTWFEDQLKKKPYLAKPEKKPANTTTGGDNADDAGLDQGGGDKGAPSDGKGKKGKEPNFNAMDADRDALAKRKAELGLV